ncbi:MAG: Cna B-type domain-containing protein [Ruminococcus flavefaciens]|nr:Cna B-type domain-containing protein [Ruminococcus flavefaciens]
MLLKKSKLFSIIVCVVTVLSLFSLTIPNVANADGDKSLTLVCVSGDTVLKGIKWKLYKVGVRTNNSRNFSQTGDFAGIQVNLRRLTEDKVNEAAATFQGYAIANDIPPLREAETNERGEVEFSGLDAGLYLISGKLLKIDSHYYVPTTSLIEIKEDDENLRYDAYPKFEYEVMNDTPRRYTVRKVWTGDEEFIDGRPSSVTIAIYKDEEFYDSVVLNDENSWRYSWVDSAGSSWIAMEKDVPEHYELNIKYDSSRYIIENIYSEEPFTTTTVQNSGTTTTTSQPKGSETSTTTTATVSGLTVTNSRTTTTTATVSGLTVTNSRTTTTATTTDDVGNGTVSRTRTTATTQNNDKVTTTTRYNGGGSGGNGGGSGGGNGSGNGSGSGSSGKLPQTGQLWWPVVPLSIGGILLIAIGLVIKARKKSES